MLTIELDAGDQIGVGQVDRIGAFGSLAIEGGIERGACRPGLEPTRTGIGVGWNKAVSQDDVAARDNDNYREQDAEDESSHRFGAPSLTLDVIEEVQHVAGELLGVLQKGEMADLGLQQQPG